MVVDIPGDITSLDASSLNAVQRRCLAVLQGGKANEELHKAATTMLRNGGVPSRGRAGAVEKVPTEKAKAKSKQRKEKGAESSGAAWACAACTLMNAPGATVCSACEAPAPRQPQAQSWSCEACTLANDEKDVRCRACGHGRSKKRCAPAIPFFDDDDDFVS